MNVYKYDYYDKIIFLYSSSYNKNINSYLVYLSSSFLSFRVSEVKKKRDESIFFYIFNIIPLLYVY